MLRRPLGGGLTLFCMIFVVFCGSGCGCGTVIAVFRNSNILYHVRNPPFNMHTLYKTMRINTLTSGDVGSSLSGQGGRGRCVVVHQQVGRSLTIPVGGVVGADAWCWWCWWWYLYRGFRFGILPTPVRGCLNSPGNSHVRGPSCYPTCVDCEE